MPKVPKSEEGTPRIPEGRESKQKQQRDREKKKEKESNGWSKVP